MSRRADIWRGYEQALLLRHRNLERRYEKIFKADDIRDDSDDEERLDDDIDDDEERLDDDSGSGNGNGNLVDQLADQLVEAGSPDGAITREQALQYLLHSERGQALVARMAAHRKSNRKDFQMTRDETLRSIVKRHNGVVGLCKHINATGAAIVTEHELVALATEQAKRQYGISDDARAFAKMFTDTGPDSQMLQKAVQITKVAQVGGDDGDADDVAAALQKLHRLAEQHQRDNPALTPDQSFARVFADPRNAALAQRAHKRPVANEKMLYPFPR
jgi:hypothetical protein